MKRIVIFSLLVLATSYLEPKTSWAKVKFADETIKEDVKHICKKYELIQKLYAQLSSSNLTYVIRYGETRMLRKCCAEGIFQTDGETLYLTFTKIGWTEYSLPARFAHEATHALQFEKGKIGFIQNSSGEWEPVNYDIMDEAEAFQMMLPVADRCDLIRKRYSYPGNKVVSDLGRFKRELNFRGLQEAAQWLCNIYPKISQKVMNNPSFDIDIMNAMWAKRGCTFYCMPYQPKMDTLSLIWQTCTESKPISRKFYAWLHKSVIDIMHDKPDRYFFTQRDGFIGGFTVIDNQIMHLLGGKFKAGMF